MSLVCPQVDRNVHNADPQLLQSFKQRKTTLQKKQARIKNKSHIDLCCFQLFSCQTCACMQIFFSLKRPRKKLVDAPQWLLPVSHLSAVVTWRLEGAVALNADEADNEDYRPIWKITFMPSAQPSQVFCVQQWGRPCGGKCLTSSSLCSFSQLVRVCPQERQWALQELGVAGETSAGRIRTHSTPSPLNPPLSEFPLWVFSIWKLNQKWWKRLWEKSSPRL